MRKTIVLAAILVASFFAVGTASAQSIGIGVTVRNGHGHVGVYVGGGHGHHGYPQRDCRGCGRDYGRDRDYRDYRNYNPAPIREVITVYVNQLVDQRVYDPSCGRYVWTQRWIQVPVRAYWDHRVGGYWYTDSQGYRVRAN